MTRIFFSEWAWRLIPMGTSVVCSLGLVWGAMLLGIARRNHVNHLSDEYRKVAIYLHRRASTHVRVHALLVCAGVLFTVAWLPAPPAEGAFIFAYVNHYIVGIASVDLTRLAYLNLRDRLASE